LTSPPSEIGSDNLESCSRRPSPPSSSSSTLQRLFQVPTLARFFADFTLGFADGLTVPFALTAGLSSLGHTDTVIYAGMAEICAGSISMGIGGYLAARGEVTAAAAAEKPLEDRDYDAEGAVATVQNEKGFPVSDDVVARYLDPLDLPLQLHDMVTRHIRSCPAIAETLLELKGKEENEDERLPSPLMAGLSVAVGYLLGGMIPLFPYFLVSEVQDGMVWSFVTCAVALFVFGFCKDLVLSGRSRPVAAAGDARVKVRWSAVRRSAWEGMQMVFLGSVAALAAVALVRAFEGFRVDQPAQTR
jgi:VIT1/CCC1 family predicted Fe2+/Mn2+ transporter